MKKLAALSFTGMRQLVEHAKKNNIEITRDSTKGPHYGKSKPTKFKQLFSNAKEKKWINIPRDEKHVGEMFAHELGHAMHNKKKPKAYLKPHTVTERKLKEERIANSNALSMLRNKKDRDAFKKTQLEPNYSYDSYKESVKNRANRRQFGIYTNKQVSNYKRRLDRTPNTWGEVSLKDKISHTYHTRKAKKEVSERSNLEIVQNLPNLKNILVSKKPWVK